jgi:hypothetical protein
VSGSIIPPGGGGAPPPVQSFAQAIAQVTQIPAQLRNQIFAALQNMTLANALAQGGQNPQAQVQGQVVGRDQSGATLVRTDAGTVGIRTQMPLPVGASITLQIGGTPQIPQAVIVQVQPPAPPGTAQPAPAGAPPPTAAPSAGPQAPAPATDIAPSAQTRPAAQTVATVVGPPPQAAAPARTPPPPQAPTAAAGPALPQPTAVAGMAAQAAAPPAAAAQQVLQTGTSVQIRILPDVPAPQVPTAAQAAAAAPPRSQHAESIQARVVAHTPGGQTLLDTPFGRLAATWPAGLPRPAEGARVAVELALPLLAKVLPGAAGEPALKSSVPLAREWPNLKEAIRTLTESDPALAKRVLDEGLPRPGPRLATQVLSFLATDRTDARAMLGENVAGALERAGRGDVVQRLDADLREMQRQNAASTDWRVAYVPVWDGRELAQMRLFSRREGEKGKGGRDSKRFVVELDFSEFGEVQIDGLMRKPRLELMLRTHRQLPADMRDEIEVVFLDGCTLAGLAGRIYFQAMDRFPVAPLEEIAKKDRGVVA